MTKANEPRAPRLQGEMEHTAASSICLAHTDHSIVFSVQQHGNGTLVEVSVEHAKALHQALGKLIASFENGGQDVG